MDDANADLSEPRVSRHLCVAKTMPTSEGFREPKNKNSSFPKPRGGGLWTSPPREGGGTGWTDWCLSEGFQEPPFHFYEVIPSAEAKWTVIDTYGDLHDLMREYGRRAYPDQRPGDVLYDSWVLDWVKLGQDFDAVHLTEDGQWATRLTHPYDLYGWDCESTLWLRWVFDDVLDLGLWSPETVGAQGV